MLAKKHRLNLSLANEDNKFDFQSSERFLTNHLIFYFQQNHLKTLRVAAIAPKRIFDKASQRNLHRRLIYNFLREKISQINKTQNTNFFKESLDLAIVYKQKNPSQEDIKKDINSFFLKIQNEDRQ